jgi:AAA domain
LTLLASKSQCILLTGAAGSGKSFVARECVNCDPRFGLLTATTGIAAKILSTHTSGEVKTLNSTLGFYDYDSLFRSRDHGTLRKNILRLKKQFRYVTVDECSMLRADVFQLLVEEFTKARMGLIVVGDFLQLPAVAPKPRPAGLADHIFQTEAFSRFEVIKLETQFRQTNPDFIAGLNLLRAGDGASAVPLLKSAGVSFIPGGYKVPLSGSFNGTTLCATNDVANQFNKQQYTRLQGDEHVIPTVRRGNWSAEADWRSIPDEVRLKQRLSKTLSKKDRG